MPSTYGTWAETFVQGQTAQPRERQERRPYPTSGWILRGFLENAHSQPRSSQGAPPLQCLHCSPAWPQHLTQLVVVIFAVLFWLGGRGTGDRAEDFTHAKRAVLSHRGVTSLTLF